MSVLVDMFFKIRFSEHIIVINQVKIIYYFFKLGFLLRTYFKQSNECLHSNCWLWLLLYKFTLLATFSNILLPGNYWSRKTKCPGYWHLKTFLLTIIHIWKSFSNVVFLKFFNNVIGKYKAFCATKLIFKSLSLIHVFFNIFMS